MRSKLPPQSQVPAASPPPSTGLFITAGLNVSIPEGGLTVGIGPNGGAQTKLVLHVSLNMWLHWLEIGYQHLLTAEKASGEVQAALAEADDKRLGDALTTEFMEGMQAMSAAGIALDAFYASVKERVEIPKELRDSWKTNGTARYKQIAEVLRQSFRIRPAAHIGMIQMLKQVFQFRDWAVHPPADSRAPVLHPDLKKHTEWRFAAFRFANAKGAVHAATSLIAQLGARPQEKWSELKRYCDGLRPSIDEHVARWESRYGLLGEREADHSVESEEVKTTAPKSA